MSTLDDAFKYSSEAAPILQALVSMAEGIATAISQAKAGDSQGVIDTLTATSAKVDDSLKTLPDRLAEVNAQEDAALAAEYPAPQPLAATVEAVRARLAEIGKP